MDKNKMAAMHTQMQEMMVQMQNMMGGMQKMMDDMMNEEPEKKFVEYDKMPAEEKKEYDRKSVGMSDMHE